MKSLKSTHSDCLPCASDEGFPLGQLNRIKIELLWIGLHNT